ncbi:MAG TPA: ABC transporter permease [Gemmatimonadaceae bacterium]|nr:ABC transporter permease [Gemmatimonadaceae bacterium]
MSSGLPARVRRAFRLALRRRDQSVAETDEEIQFHLAQRIEALIARGVPAEQARAEAMRRFGSYAEGRAMMLEAARTRDATLTLLERLDGVRQELAYTVRQLCRAPGFTIAVVISLALGIGANATMFGIIDRVLLRPISGVVAPDRVVSIGEMRRFGGVPYRNTTLSYPAYTDYRDHVPAFSAVGAATEPQDVSLGRGEGARSIQVMFVTPSYLALTGARPALGRFFTPDEDRLPSGADVAVVTHGFWERELGGASDALGTALDIGTRRFIVVGIAPPDFTGLQHGPVDVFVPLSAGAELEFGHQDWATTRFDFWLQIYGRLAAGASPAAVETQATAVLRSVATKPDDSTSRVVVRSVAPASDDSGADIRVAKLLAGVSVLVLLIACCNVANLLLCRAVQRRREIAVRLALGIGRGRLVAQLLGESLVLALSGGAAAVLVVRWGGALVRRLLLTNWAWEGSGVDGRVLVFTGVVALLVGIGVGLLPAMQTSAPELWRDLKEGVREGFGRRARARSVLLLAQATFVVVLLVGAGLFVRSLVNVDRVQLGMDTGRVLVGTMDLGRSGYSQPQVEELYRRMQARVQQLGGVASASVGVAMPFRSSFAAEFRIPGRDSLPAVQDGGPYVNAVDAGFFRTLGIRIVRGRGFTDEDNATHARVMVVSQTMARLFWPGVDPIGQCVIFASDSLPCTRIVGIAADAHRDQVVQKGDVLQYYVRLEYAAAFMTPRVLFVRPADGDVARWIAPVQRAMESSAPGLPYANVRSMQSLLEPQLRSWELGASMFAIFGGVALALAAVGLYGVISYGVAQRTHEVGVRVALGAQRADVVRLVVGQAVRVTVAGLVLGLVLVSVGVRWVEPLLYGVSGHDPLTLGIVCGALLGVALAASAFPAKRAASVDPVRALRAE